MSARTVHDLLRRPIVVAPMAGGPTGPELVLAACGAGALAFLAGGYKSCDAMKDEVETVRAGTSEAFGVNVFVPGRPTTSVSETISYVSSLAEEASSLEVDLGEASWDDDDWQAKLHYLSANPVPIVSFTFGAPDAGVVRALREAGSVVAITVTLPEEARLAQSTGADCLCVQGFEAGAHRGTFENGPHSTQGPELLDLMSGVAEVSDLPQIAAGGIMNRASVEEVLRRGAIAAQCGTAFLRCPESGADPLHKHAIGDGRFKSTSITRSFSGRPARGLVNRFMVDHPYAPAAYPEINNATRPLRAAAAARGDVERMSLWAGRGFKEATTRPAGEVVDALCPSRRRLVAG